MNHMYYYSWFGVNFFMTILRTTSLNYMLSAYTTLLKKADDHRKKLKARREKTKKMRRSSKKELNRNLGDKRNELYRKN